MVQNSDIGHRVVRSMCESKIASPAAAALKGQEEGLGLGVAMRNRVVLVLREQSSHVNPGPDDYG